jgi:hypothetical protein
VAKDASNDGQFTNVSAALAAVKDLIGSKASL